MGPLVLKQGYLSRDQSPSSLRAGRRSWRTIVPGGDRITMPGCHSLAALTLALVGKAATLISHGTGLSDEGAEVGSRLRQRAIRHALDQLLAVDRVYFWLC
jgi:hypothetical protein